MVAGSDVVITGYGVFTAFGFGEQALLDGVFQGRHGFGPVRRFDTGRFRCDTAATYTGAGPGYPGMHAESFSPPRQREVLTACSSAAIAMSGLEPSKIGGAIVGSQGDYTPITAFWRGDGEPVADSLPGHLSHALADRLGLGPYRSTFVNACVASADAIIHAARLIRAGRVDALLCAGAYLVEEELFAKFDSARAFAKDGIVRPFAKDRTGLLLGDGVAGLVLESGRSARARGAEVLARVAGWGITSDAFHVSRPHPQGRGTADAFRAALRTAKLDADRIDYVNVHGTGTASNDTAETAALHDVLGARAPKVAVSSTKSTTGHPLEGAGAVEAVITLLALRHGTVPPTANFTTPDPACDLDYVTDVPREVGMDYAVSLNSAFGGVNTAIVLERR
ncbi:3-oxoacyl-[acyl-carrier-protein] synthase II [Amycolatopsis lexingtonensis]|uniref:3-oxoacyl-[acyl-carrier-protein] synthase II n=1 Tax=Amycolatopsis lexingtonensis TaxID=218822 RepID=A0ABR9IFT7_9PSEU|nr:beta-ketoacyl-[acyl-carrier-protein] synthase family protein [Amycolatopsis lexingtonensis]MBE1501817.1 3-oxoacyl-[acyl-carrier-protein] synthase II [Amycolatopsis lexingtonensis]